MATAGVTLPPEMNGDFDNSEEDEDDAIDANAADASFNNGPTTSQDSGSRLRPLLGARGDRPGHTVDHGRGTRRAAVVQYVGKHYPAISVVEEERTTDDASEEDDVLGGSSTGTTTAPVDDGLPHYVVDYPQGARMRYPRISLLGKPLGYRASRRDTRLKRIQGRIYIFLERPKTWAAITYHTSV